MSRLQSALQSYPQGTVISRQMEETDRVFHQHERETREAEVTLAKQVQHETGCSWPDALKAVVRTSTT